MGMRIVGVNKRLRDLRHILAPLTWHTEAGPFEEYKFKADPTRPNTIIGHWAEDGNPYEITCPAQLRNALVVGLNLLNHIYIR